MITHIMEWEQSIRHAKEGVEMERTTRYKLVRDTAVSVWAEAPPRTRIVFCKKFAELPWVKASYLVTIKHTADTSQEELQAVLDLYQLRWREDLRLEGT